MRWHAKRIVVSLPHVDADLEGRAATPSARQGLSRRVDENVSTSGACFLTAVRVALQEMRLNLREIKSTGY